jgi:hypothetical protein
MERLIAVDFAVADTPDWAINGATGKMEKFIGMHWICSVPGKEERVDIELMLPLDRLQQTISYLQSSKARLEKAARNRGT